MSYSYNKNYPANAGKTNYGLNSFAAYLAKEDEKKKKETPPYKPESQKKTLTPFEKMADISKNITGGARIKQNVEDALTKNYPSGNYKGIFDGIDEKKIENNISLADDVIKKNTAGGAYKITPRENLPWLRDGLALFYASAEQGDSKAANAARKLAYTEVKDEASSVPVTSNKRYVNADIGLNVRESPGTGSEKIGYLNYNDEVEFTGNKTGEINNHLWAEIKYGDKTGWVAAEYLNLEKPSETDNSSVTKPQNNVNTAPEKPEEKPEEKNKTEPGTRYVGEKTVGMRAMPGFRGRIKTTIDYGQSVEYTGNCKILDGIRWAEIKYGDKTGWVIANSLRTKRSSDMPYAAEWMDEDKLREIYAKVKHPDSDVYGDFDNYAGLQCVDATNWFIDTYTTLKRTTGNGYQKVENIAALRPDLEISTIPSAPAVYSIAPGKPGPGVGDLSDEDAGHTGIVLDVKPHPEKEGTYIIKIFHTYTNLLNKGVNCAIEDYDFTPNDGVTFVNIGNYLK